MLKHILDKMIKQRKKKSSRFTQHFLCLLPLSQKQGSLLEIPMLSPLSVLLLLAYLKVNKGG